MPRARKPVAVAHPTGRPQPVAAPTGMPYGSHQAATTAQQAVPLPGTPSLAPPPGAPPAGPSAAPGGDNTTAPMSDQAALAALQQHDFQPVGLVSPTNRPGEPVTSGLDYGPGAGPEAMGGMPDPTQQDIQSWRPLLPTLEYLASQPNSTASTRNFVRRLRSLMPPAATAQ